MNDFGSVNEDASIRGLDADFVDINGIRTRYYDEGDGIPVVLLHGGNWDSYNSANVWAENIIELSDNFRVIAPDRLASGLTENPLEPDEYKYESELNHMQGFLKELGLEKYHLIGSSRGGGLAARIAVETPKRVLSLVLTNSATLGSGAGDRDFRWDRLTRGKPTGGESRSFYEEEFRYIRDIYCYNTDNISDEYVKAAAYMKSQPKTEERNKIMEMISDDKSTYELKGYADTWAETLEEHMIYTREQIRRGTLNLPVLIYWGRNDLTVRLGEMMNLFDLFDRNNPQTRLKLISRCGHLPFLEHPKEFNQDITNFIK